MSGQNTGFDRIWVFFSSNLLRENFQILDLESNPQFESSILIPIIFFDFAEFRQEKKEERRKEKKKEGEKKKGRMKRGDAGNKTKKKNPTKKTV